MLEWWQVAHVQSLESLGFDECNADPLNRSTGQHGGPREGSACSPNDLAEATWMLVGVF